MFAIVENKPKTILHWYDRLPKSQYRHYGVNKDEVASSVQNYSPMRSVAIWQEMAESLIAQVKPRAYREAAKYLRKAGALMNKHKKQKQWASYIAKLKENHKRKTRLMEILDRMDGGPIVKKKL